MALVPAPIYTAWFSKTSWVYRHFSYWFVNPLWQRSVPKGFSLCPFFWLALISLFLLRPLVYLTIALRSVCRLLRLNRVLDFTDRISPFSGPRGVPTVVSVLVFGWFGTILGLAAWQGLLGLVLAYEWGYLSPFLALLASLATTAACAIYCERHKGDRCKVEVYLRVVLGISVTAVAVLQPALFVDWFLLGLPKLAWFALGLVWAALAHIWGFALWCLGCVAAGLPFAWIAAAGLAAGMAYGWFVSRHAPVSGPDAAAVIRLSSAEIHENLSFIAGELWYTLSNDEEDFVGRIKGLGKLVRACPECLDLARSKPDIMEEEARALKPVILALAAVRKRRADERSEACKRMTGALVVAFAPITALWKQVRILVSYLWALVKSRKQGVCPYLQFHD